MECPDCDGETRNYHESHKDGGRSRTVCLNKCNGWKVLRIREPFGKWEYLIDTRELNKPLKGKKS